MLLHWCTLEPAGSSNVAAIRFSAAVRVQSIRIFPSGAQPFELSPDITARTEPDTFFLDIFFHAQQVRQPGSKQQQKPTNALAPTALAYAGGQMDFNVDMGQEYATRLMIVKGNFSSVSLAIYGEVAAESSVASSYEPKPTPIIEPSPLSRVLDPSNSTNPTHLAQQLLDMIPDAPPLPLVIRLMFCLKPSNDDWDRPDFPYIYADLDEDSMDLDLETAFRLTARPVSDDVSQETLQRFAGSVEAAMGPHNDSQSYLIAGILSHAASQHPDMAKLLMGRLDLSEVFDPNTMDEGTLLRLVGASSNADIARHLDNPWFLDLLNAIQVNSGATDREVRAVVRKVMTRVRGWQILEDALSNSQGDFNETANFLKEIGTDEQSFGIWLESFVTHQDLVTKLSENPVIPNSPPQPPLLFQNRQRVGSVSHAEFILFLRAYIGVACVLAVFAWADSLPNKRCRERALGIMRLWQSVDGYREILNHLLLLRQMAFRLECNLDNDPPTHSGISAEHILSNLSQIPQSILSPDLIKCILSLRQPLSYITEDERTLLRSLAILADDGLPAAMEELVRFSSKDAPMDERGLRSLRVALAVVERDLDGGNDGDGPREWRALQALWDESSHGLVLHLADPLAAVTAEIKGYFALKPPPPTAVPLLSQLFDAAHELLRLLVKLIPVYPLPGRPMRALVSSVADLFVCTDAADALYSQSSPSCVAAQASRQICIDTVRTLVTVRNSQPEGGRHGAEVVLQALLKHALERDDSKDWAHHLLQVFSLIDHLLPIAATPEDTIWIRQVIPGVLPELAKFFRVLDRENKVHLIRRLAALDQGEIGIGEWLLLEELKHLSQTLKILESESIIGEQYAMMGRHEVALSLRLLSDLAADSSSTASAWYTAAISTNPEIALILADSLVSMWDKQFSHPSLVHFVQTLAATSPTGLDPMLLFGVTLTLIRFTDVSSSNIHLILRCLRTLKGLPGEYLKRSRFQLALGEFLLVAESQDFASESAEAIIPVLQWLLIEDLAIIRGASAHSVQGVCDSLRSVTSSDKHGVINSFQSNVSIVDDAPFSPPIPLPENLELSIEDLTDLLHPEIKTPSTPPQKPISYADDVFGLVTVSPHTALLRSPAVTGLTKTYANNDFRQLRQTPSARQNTSRLPSMHVDQFEFNTISPTLIPVGLPLLAPNPVAADLFHGLSPAFNTQ
ncbi:hypothetical protein JAAARDRAFT_145190 [Jaapia argillacea MUCL 33604]|uniref:Virilizer N-terminal domain-containing protein n=1 Tax=Jaapia argillacea MUCL 33604 TaxID=933084 RepID=A0A067QE92_9AGAM|nr:hypothetical protein JAAARDRAFT_145190 [Jaapia argillacea MUCL 33604]